MYIYWVPVSLTRSDDSLEYIINLLGIAFQNDYQGSVNAFAVNLWLQFLYRWNIFPRLCLSVWTIWVCYCLIFVLLHSLMSHPLYWIPFPKCKYTKFKSYPLQMWSRWAEKEDTNAYNIEIQNQETKVKHANILLELVFLTIYEGLR